MDSWVRCWAGAIGTLASVGLAGCASGPDPEVARAQAAVQEARDDQAVAEYAPKRCATRNKHWFKPSRGNGKGWTMRKSTTSPMSLSRKRR